jgi:hypothetical protein
VANQLEKRESEYREASRTFDYFVTGFSSLFLLFAALFFEITQHRVASSALGVAAIALFAVSVISGVKKLEYSVTILGAYYSVVLTESGQSNLASGESTAVLQDLHDTIVSFTNKASFVHRLRNWAFGLGIVFLTAAKIFEMLMS